MVNSTVLDRYAWNDAINRSSLHNASNKSPSYMVGTNDKVGEEGRTREPPTMDGTFPIYNDRLIGQI
jgi:hypothetical protein